jgi:pyridoxine 5-phosphate synthase
VPDGPGVLTSEEGWKLDNRDTPLVNASVAMLKKHGARVILFIDPDPTVIDRVPGTGADGVEIYTGGYADAFRHGDADAMRDACAATAARAAARGLVVNAGHDLNLENLPTLVAAMPNLAEASIGHELTADALKMGWQNAVRAYKAALAGTP